MSILLLIIVCFLIVLTITHHVWLTAAAHLFHPHIAGWLLGGLVVLFLLVMFASHSIPMAQTPSAAVQINTVSGNREGLTFSDSQPRAVKLTLLMMVVAAVALLFALGFRTRLHTHIVPIVLTILAFILGMAFFWGYATTSSPYHVTDEYNSSPASSVPLPPGYHNGPQQIILAEQTNAHPAAKTNRKDKQSPAKAKTDGQNSKEANATVPEKTTTEPGDERSTVTENTAADSLPAWIHNTKPSHDGNFYVVVGSGTYADPKVRDAMLDDKMVAAANSVIDNQIFRELGAADGVKIDATYLREHCLDKQYPPDDAVNSGDEIYVRLKFGEQFRADINRQYQEYLASFRIHQLGVFSLAGFALLGGLYFYLRKTTPKAESPLAA